MRINNKSVLITGASSGIGMALARQLADRSCNLVLLGRRIGILEELAQELSGSSRHVLPIECDVSKRASVADAMRLIRRDFPPLDLAVMNAGLDKFVPLDRYSSADATQVFGVNVFGAIHWIEALMPTLRSGRSFRLACMSSLSDTRGLPGNAFYSAAKRAIRHYLESLRVELRPYPVKVITIRPGFVRTPMTAVNTFEMPMAMSPERAANHVVRALTVGRRVYTFPALAGLAMALFRLVPAPIFETLAYRTYRKLVADAAAREGRRESLAPDDT